MRKRPLKLWRVESYARPRVIIMLVVLFVMVLTPLMMGRSAADSAGPIYASSCVDNAGTGTIAWTPSGSCKTTVTATLTSATTSHYLYLTGFGVNVPADATVTGVQVQIEKYADAATTYNKITDSTVRLLVGGSLTGSNLATSATWPSDWTYVSYGGSTNLWGTTLSVAQVNSSQFGVAMSAVSVHSGLFTNTLTANFFTAAMTVYYNLNSTFNQASYRIFANQDASNAAGFASGTSWAQATPGASWNSREGAASTVFNNKMWVLGGNQGSTYFNDVWYSSDGQTWTEATAAAPWSGREEPALTVFNNKLWLYGGKTGNGTYANDVWYSSDGVTWTQATAAAPWAARGWTPGVVFNNKLWVMGGAGAAEYNDVWSSSDGVTWTQATAAAPWATRDSMPVLVYNSKLWILGGCSSTSTTYNDVWSSSDGVTWTRATSGAAWATRQGAVALVYNSKMWIMGGDDQPTATVKYNDVWSSSDGVSWTQVTGGALWGGRAFATGAVYNNTMWVMGGGDITSTVQDDVWSASNLNPIDVGAPLADQNVAATVPGDGQPFRLRMDVGIGAATLPAKGLSFQLQFAAQSGGSCSATPSANYANVTNSTSGIQYYRNTNAGNGQSIQTDANDPTDGANVIVPQSYQQADTTTFTPSADTAAGQDTMWDFALTTSRSVAGTHYCLRLYIPGHGGLDTSTQYPEIVIPSATVSQGPYRWLANDVTPGAGAVTEHVSSGSDAAESTALDTTNGYAYPVGYDQSPGYHEWRIEKRNMSDGRLVSGFGVDGAIVENITTGDSVAENIAIDTAGGYMYVAGYDTSTAGHAEWRIEKRNLSDGSLVSGFGTGGIITEVPSGTPGVAFGITIVPADNAMYLNGYDATGFTDAWRIEKRTLSTGALVSGFGTGGVVSEGGTWDMISYSVAVDPTDTYIYVVGYDENNSNKFSTAEWRIEKRATSNGSLSTSVSETIGPTYPDQARKVAIDSTGTYIYVVGLDGNAGSNPEWRIEKRATSNLSLITGISENPSSGSNVAYGAALDNTNGYLYVVGYDDAAVAGTAEWRIEKRAVGSLALVSGFGTGGVVTYDQSSGGDGAFDLQVNPSGGYLYTVGINAGAPGLKSQWELEQRSLTTGALITGSATPLANAGAAYDPVTLGDVLRLRVLLRVDGSLLALGGQTLKLQYALKTGSCSASVYGDVTSSTPISYYSQAGLTNGSAVVGVPQDPTDGSRFIGEQSYQDSSPFQNAQSLLYANEDGLWDFSLKLSPSLTEGSDICLRVAGSDGSPLAGGYAYYPEIQFGPGNIQRMRLGKWFDSNGTLQPFFLTR